jgi:hypothetical protein
MDGYAVANQVLLRPYFFYYQPLLGQEMCYSSD